jgi:hypothetical protein
MVTKAVLRGRTYVIAVIAASYIYGYDSQNLKSCPFFFVFGSHPWKTRKVVKMWAMRGEAE